MAFPAVTYTNNLIAASGLVSNAAEAGLSIAGLDQIGQLQSVVANLLVNQPTTLTLPAGDVLSGTFGANDSDTGTYTFPSAIVVTTQVTFVTKTVSSTALATPSALAATAFNAFASTVSGATLMGFGTTGDVTLKNRAGTDVLVVTANTTAVALAGALGVTGATTMSSTLRVNGAASLGTAAGTDQTVIDGTAFGAGVASIRFNGLTTAAITNQTGTLLNAPVVGNPSFWMPVSIAGTVKYIPCW